MTDTEITVKEGGFKMLEMIIIATCTLAMWACLTIAK